MFASQDDGAAYRGEISKVPLCSGKKLTSAAFIHVKEKDPSGPVKILTKQRMKPVSPEHVHTYSTQQTANHASWQALKGHEGLFPYLK